MFGLDVRLIGHDAESMMVLEYSLRKFCSKPVIIHWMKLNNDINSMYYVKDWNVSLWATPFSGFRWTIPEAMNFSGIGVYMDSDMIILSDLAKLWNQEFEDGKVVMAKGGSESWRYCVCMWDCYRAQKYIPSVKVLRDDASSHSFLMKQFSSGSDIVQPFKGNWNCIDMEGFDNFSEIDILHYSDMSTQPHLKYAIPRLEAIGEKHWFDGKIRDHWRPQVINLFDKYYNEALAEGYKVSDYTVDKNDFIYYNKESQYEYGRSFRAHEYSK